MNKKVIKIIDLHVDYSTSGMRRKDNVLAEALYESAKGTKHFYETLELLIRVMPDIEFFKEEFEKLKTI